MGLVVRPVECVGDDEYLLGERVLQAFTQACRRAGC
jgi:hypothetical protein